MNKEELKEKMIPKPGQIWKENDNRFDRKIKVLSVDGIWVTVENVSTGRKTSCNISRFSGKRSGYSLVEG